MRDRGYTILKWSVIALAWLSYPILIWRLVELISEVAK